MDEKAFESLVSRLERVAKILEKLPTEIRNDAFGILKSYIIEQSQAPVIKKTQTSPQSGTECSEEAFFDRFDQGKPADNAKLIAAYFYGEYGVEPFSLEEIRKKADDVGITVPARLDKTFLKATEKGRNLFARAGRGNFKPTVLGEAYLKSTYSVLRGKKKRVEVSQ